jgi:trimethylamine--corrinoid protein Co-methyltransferase
MDNDIPPKILVPRLQILSETEILALHHASLDILSQTGVAMRNVTARELLLASGASEADGRIKIPPHVVTDAIASAPPRIPMHNRLGALTMPLEADRVFFGPGSDCCFTIDVESGQRRPTQLADVERIARLCDALKQIDFLMSMGVSSDAPPLDHYVHEFVAMMRGSVKPIVYTANNRTDMESIYRIACAVAGGERQLREKPFLMLYAEPISPLLFPHESVDKLLFCAEKGLPAAFPPSPNTGGGGPITVAGALALGNAECLVGLVLAQLVRRGSPFLYGMNIAALDMKSAIVSYGAPEWPLAMLAYTDLARYYKLPVWGVSGATDSKLVDAQAGIEATVTTMSAFLARCNLNHDVGYLEYGSTSSMEMLVIVDEIIRDLRFMMAGLEVSERTLAREAIHRVLPGKGFLVEDHTLQNWRWAQWRPGVIDRRSYDDWVGGGSKDMAARANERARKILAEHETPQLPKDVETEIAKVLTVRRQR